MISQEIRQQAADWAVELTTTRPTAQRWDEFEGWIAMSPQHREAYTRAERAWRASPTEVSQSNQCVETPRRIPIILIQTRIALFAVIATVVVAVATGVVIWVNLHTPWTAYESLDNTRDISLSDGSFVTLNSHSLIHFRVTFWSREVTMERGQGMFKVAHSFLRPFLVRANQTRVIAVGTQYLVHIVGPEEVDTLVIEGSVRVKNPGDGFIGPLILPGQMAISRNSHSVREVLQPAEIDRQTAWFSQPTEFNGTLDEVIQRFNRYSSPRLIIVDPKLANRHVSGTYRRLDPLTFAHDLADTHHISSTIVRGADGQDRILLRAGQ
jgi:transmembrane sensor